MELGRFLRNLLWWEERDNEGKNCGMIFLQVSFVICTIVICRALYLIFLNISSSNLKTSVNLRTDSLRTMIVIGSGGHTMEMLSLVKNMNPHHYSPRIYVMADSDTSSESKIVFTEESLSKKACGDMFCHYYIIKFPRSRHVGQSFFTSVFSTMFSSFKCIPIMACEKPELILCNGPGTCVPICIIAFFMRVLFHSKCVIIFIESICRVKSLSLTGRILYYFADVVLVQWHDLVKKYKRAIYIGRV